MIEGGSPPDKDPVPALGAGSSVAQALALARDADQRTDLRVLLGWALQRPSAWLLTHGNTELPAAGLARFNAAWAGRCAGQPVAYLTGAQEFHGLPFAVGPGTLIPRADTELLVDLTLQLCAASQVKHVLDLGTGSGAVALSLAVRRPSLHITATDCMPEALVWARRNSHALGVSDRVELVAGRWLNAVAHRQFDLIVSNPPYIAEGDPHLDQGDLRFEPRSALTAGADGLSDLREIARTAPAHLVAGGVLLLEHGYDQGASVRALLGQAGFLEVRTERDLGHQERVTLGFLR